MPYAATTAITEFWAKCKAAFAPKSHTHPYAASPSAGGNAAHTNAFLFGYVDSTSTATDFTATVEGLTALYDGVAVMLHNGIVTSASGFVLNVNNLGDKPVYSNMATGNDVTPTAPTRDTTIFNINYTMLFVYDSQLVDGGAWICYRGYDANTNTIGYQLRTNSGNMVASDTGYRYRLWLTQADGKKWVPINTSTSTNNTSARTLNTRHIDPFGRIVYRATNGTCNAGAGIGATGIWDQYVLSIGYSYMASGFSLTFPAPVYLRCTPNTDGSATMEVITQTLPSSKDGKIYIHLGTAYSASNMELEPHHPVYWHDGTGLRVWTGAEPSSGPSPSSTTPAMDGTAAVGTSANYARADHVHPTDTSRQAALVSGTNIKTVGSQSLLGSGNLTPANIGAAAATHSHAASEISSGTLDAARLPIATASALGGVKPDGTTITVDSSGVISAAGGSSSSGWEDVTSQCRMVRVDTGTVYPAYNYVAYSNGCFLLLKNVTPEWEVECKFYPPSGYKFVCPTNSANPLGINVGLTFSNGMYAIVGAQWVSDVYGLFPIIEAS